jgi:hypothetical protein
VNPTKVHLARVSPLRLNGSHAGRGRRHTLRLTALISYSIGRQDAPSAAQYQSQPSYSKPVALVDTPLDVPAIKPQPAPSPSSTPSAKATQPPPTAPQSETKRRVEIVLTVATIAAIIVKASRDRYCATGHPCACPDDLMRNGQACGGRSAYSRPGGAAPLCYPTDVSAEMIDAYRKTVAR